MPTWTAAHAALDTLTFAAWLDAQALTDPQLRWYLDYCCRDDYGATAAEVSAWAGLHYFASRHGFHPPGDEAAEREAVLTWPEGNALLTRRMAGELAGRIHSGRTVLRVQTKQKHQVEVLETACPPRPAQRPQRHPHTRPARPRANASAADLRAAAQVGGQVAALHEQLSRR